MGSKPKGRVEGAETACWRLQAGVDRTTPTAQRSTMPTTTKGRKVRREATQSSPADKDQRPIVRKAQGGSATVKGRGKSANGQLNPKDKVMHCTVTSGDSL